MNYDIFIKIDNYIGNLLAYEDKVLSDTIKSLDAEGFPQHSITANQGKFLQVMMIASSAKKVLEIGTLAGYSTIWLARALPKDGKLITIEVDNRYAEVAKKNIAHAGLTNQIDLIIGNAMDILPLIIDQNSDPFDLIFIDANKPFYTEYFDFALKISRPGTIIIFDNVIRAGKVLDDNSLDDKVKGVQRLNRLLSQNNKVTATILQTVGIKEHDGMLIAVVNRLD